MTGADPSVSSELTKASLLHNHLPLLERLGAIDVDGETITAKEPEMATLSGILGQVRVKTSHIDDAPGWTRGELRVP